MTSAQRLLIELQQAERADSDRRVLRHYRRCERRRRRWAIRSGHPMASSRVSRRRFGYGLTVAQAPPQGGGSFGPGAAWNGSAGSGGIAPAEDVVQQGSGFIQKAIGNFDEPLFAYLTADKTITVMCDIGDDAWIREVEFWLEGSRQVVTTQTKSATTGAIGFAATISLSAFPRDGDANLWAYIRPVNGFERRIGPLTLTAIGTGVSPISRPLRYLDPAGSDANNGLTPAAAWKTVNMASRNAPSAAIIQMAAGTYLEDVNTNSPVNDPARPIEFQRAPGLNLGDVVISRTTRGVPELNWHIYSTRAIFTGIRIDPDKLPSFLFRANGTYIYQGCDFPNPGGGNGPSPSGYPWNEVQQTFFTQTLSGVGSRAYHALVDCTFTNPPTTGWKFARGCTFKSGWDAVFIDHGLSGLVCLNCTSLKTGALIQRYHTPLSLTVASTSFDGTNTVIQWSGTPNMANLTSGAVVPPTQVNFLTGTLAGGTQPALFSQDSAAFTSTVVGNFTASITAGDTAVVYVTAHSDSLQLGMLAATDAPVENIVFQRYIAKSDVTDDPATGGFQPWFLQAGHSTGPGTVTTTGVTATFTLSHTLVVGDYVKLTAGGQSLESRRVLTVDSATQVTLASAFSANQGGVAWRKCKAIKDMAVQLSVFDSPRATLDNNAQWQDAQQHIVFRQGTFHSGDIQFRTDAPNGFSGEGCLFKDSIIRSMLTVPFPTDVTLDNNHFELTPVRGTNTSSGAITLDGTYKPTAGVSRTVQSPKLKWDLYGNPFHNDGSDLVGAVKAP